MTSPAGTPATPPPTKPTKAIGAAVGTLLSTIGLALEDGKITGAEGTSIAVATIAVATIVWGLRNKPKRR